MHKHSIFEEGDVWECSAAEARKVWKEQPENRWRIWTSDEVSAHILDDPEQVRECIQAKKDKPGRID